MINYTGQPFTDVGLATISAFAKKNSPTELTEADLDKVSDYLIREYTRQPLESVATIPFAGGAYFTQPAYKNRPIKLKGTKKILKTYKSTMPTSDERCVFTRLPAVAIQLDEKGVLPLGRAARSNIPLATGVSVINFTPEGQTGLPISGLALLALHAMPLGCAKCGKQLLLVHSDNPEMMLHFARTFLLENRRNIQLAQQAGSSKLRDAQRNYRTLLIETLVKARQMQMEAREEEKPFSITAYHFSNSGQDPSLDIYHLPMQILGFLRDMQQAKYHAEWSKIVNQAWEKEPKNKRKSKKEGKEKFEPRHNWLYEDLFELPDTATTFIRKYFLAGSRRYLKNFDSISEEQPITPTSWQILNRFLRRVMLMEKEKIDAIRQMGDTLAEYVNQNNDGPFFKKFLWARSYYSMRKDLLTVNLEYTKNGKPPILDFDTFTMVFEEGEETYRRGWWSLARDLMVIRIIERLYELDWFSKNPNVVIADDEHNTINDNELLDEEVL